MRRAGILRRPVLPALLALAAGLAPQLAAQQDPNVARGFSPDKAYAVGEVDSVNLFNGNLVLTLPLGQQYAAGGALSYGLTLVYNSNVWDYEVRYVDTDFGRQPRRIALQPEEHNAGLGWTLSLGTLKQAADCSSAGNWCYVDEAGGEHAFYQTLHAGESDPTTVLYTRDGTYLRLQTVTADGYKWVESPDGTVRRFESAGGEYRLRSITDPFGNVVTVSYPSTTKWVIADAHRSHEVLFTTRSFVDESYDGQSVLKTLRMVDEVRLATVGGAVATYDFGYEETTISRSCYEEDFQEVTADTASVALLATITQPDGSTWQMDYNRTCQETTLDGASTGVPQLPGTLAELVLPTRGKYQWTYEEIHFPSRGDGINQGEQTSIGLTDTAAVASKTALNANGQCETRDGVGCTWKWAHASSLDLHTVTVTMPDGAERVHYFDQDVTLDVTTHDGWEYGLPIHPGETDSAGRHLSEELWSGTAGTSTRLRATWLRYARDRLVVSATFPSTWYDSNRRVDSRKTVYHDDGGRIATEDLTDFDGLGHYRSAATGGTFDSGNVRLRFTDYNPDSGSYNVNVAANTVSGGYVAWPTSSPWILGTSERTFVSEGTTSLERQTCFDADTGFLLRERMLAGASAGVYDVIVEHTASAEGDPVETRWYGGDLQAVGTGDLCDLELPESALYHQQRSFTAGSLASSWWVQAGGAWMGYYAERYDVDAATGLPTAAYDTANVKTSFTYDAMGRLTWAKPETGHGAWTQYKYTPATATSPPRVTVTERPNASTSGVLSQREVDFDSFGRVWRDKRQDEDGIERTATSAWNTLGWRHSQTTHGSTQTTVFRGYDTFGRPGEIETPDGQTVRMSYTGDRVVRRTVDVREANGPAAVTTTEIHDRQGRLYQVEEPSGTGGAKVTTTYGYDAADRLRTVSTSHGGVTQGRTFTYDGRGFLLSEKHPEKGTLGNGTVTYGAYDPLGNAGSRTDGPFTLAYVYDRGGRLVAAAEPAPVNRTWKTFTYGTANGASDRRLGKLVAAERHNHVIHGGTPLDVVVRESYTYGGVGGTVSARATQLFLNGTAIESFAQSFTWTDLGDPASVSYPVCTYAQCPAATNRTVTFGYGRGWLTSVPGFADAIRYNANGLLHQVEHANGVTDTWTADLHGMLRPHSISAAGTGTWWSTGTYSYDGAGNVAAMGSARFAYDGASRLISATVPKDPSNTGATRWRGYKYDTFGNLTEIAGDDDELPGCAGDEEVAGETIGTAQTRTSCAGLLAGPAVRVTGTGYLTLEAGERVVLRPGFSVAAGGRLSVRLDPSLGGGPRVPDWTYTIPVNAATNRLTNPGGGQSVAHDAAGNLTAWNGQTYSYDPFGMAWRIHTGTTDSLHLYTADDERLWTYTPSGSRWTLRDLDGKVLREYTSDAAGWRVERDYVYRDGQLLAAVSPADAKTYHYHPDHLGTPRLITDQHGQTAAYHAYWPYGEEATSSTQDDERMKFTGHERDLGVGWSTADDLDYHHARYYNFRLGRYLSPDPVIGEPKRPQSWNRYCYALANPLKWVDPTGEIVQLSGFSALEIKDLLGYLYEFTGNIYKENEDLELQLVEVGAESSGIATEFLNKMIQSSDVVTVHRTNKKNRADVVGQKDVFLNPTSFDGAKYGRVSPATFNLGSTLVHELYHAKTGLRDEVNGVFRDSRDWTGPVVDFVNEIRRERGLPIRASYVGPRGNKTHKVGFRTGDNPRERTLYVTRRNYWE